MSLPNERHIRSIGAFLHIVEGDSEAGTIVGLGFADYPTVSVLKSTLAGPLLSERDDDGSILNTPESQAIEKAIGEVEDGLGRWLDPVQAYQFVSSCIEAGYDIERDGANIAYWVVEQLQLTGRLPAVEPELAAVSSRRRSAP